MIWKLVGVVLVILGFVLFIKGISNSIKETKGEKLWYRITNFLYDTVLDGIMFFDVSIGDSLIPTGLFFMILGGVLFFNIIKYL